MFIVFRETDDMGALGIVSDERTRGEIRGGRAVAGARAGEVQVRHCCFWCLSRRDIDGLKKEDVMRYDSNEQRRSLMVMGLK